MGFQSRGIVVNVGPDWYGFSFALIVIIGFGGLGILFAWGKPKLMNIIIYATTAFVLFAQLVYVLVLA
jgi:hypothetical protein